MHKIIIWETKVTMSIKGSELEAETSSTNLHPLRSWVSSSLSEPDPPLPTGDRRGCLQETEESQWSRSSETKRNELSQALILQKDSDISYASEFRLILMSISYVSVTEGPTSCHHLQ